MDLHGDGGVPRGQRLPADGEERTGSSWARALTAARSGDESALQTIYRHLNPRLLRYLRHHAGQAAPDLASEVWMGLAEELPRFDGGASAFRALMFTIAHRRVVDHHRRSSRQLPTVPLEEAANFWGVEDTEQLAIDDLEARRAVRMLAAELPPDQAEIVLLRVLGDLDVAQVAAIVGKAPGAVRVAQHRAIRRLQRRWVKSAVTR